jgi:hypothetical protein
MRIESRKNRREVHDASGASFDDARLKRAAIDGVAVADLLAYWRAGHGAKSA